MLPAGVARRRARGLVWLVVALLPVPVPVPAPASAAEDWRVDPARSQVEFGVRLMVLRKLHGAIPQVAGQVRIDRERDQVDIDVALDARSLQMDNPRHGDWARSDEFFDTRRHPVIRFRALAQPLPRFRDGGTVHGEVTLRGITRPIVLEVEPAGCERIGRDCEVRAHGAVERSRFGMHSRRMFLGDRVELEFAIRLVDAPADPAPSSESGH
ncbi:MAG TPA: YceI family protein [Xanthomonadaceae bacterium]|nr:YceI family protein [Xanthomonadaceae bacterium]